jgi:L,D-transpeptidase ErfK/SrfK
MRSRILFELAGFLVLFITSTVGYAESFVLPPEDVSLIGGFQYTTAKHEDTLLDIARRHDVGQREIVVANPDVDRWLPREGTRVFLPKRYILPDAPRSGLVLNIAEMRLYYYPPGRKWGVRKVYTYPISIGRMDWTTPLGATRIVNKVKNPAWRPPVSIKKEHAAAGDPLPDVIPAGPDNPLGDYAMRLGIPGYLIHGTNKPLGVGMQVSHGCVRMLPEDIEQLFPEVNVGTAVHIVNQPIKVGGAVDTLYIEVQPPLDGEDQSFQWALASAMELIAKSEPLEALEIDRDALAEAIRERRGIPVAIAKRSFVDGASYIAQENDQGRRLEDGGEPYSSEEDYSYASGDDL